MTLSGVGGGEWGLHLFFQELMAERITLSMAETLETASDGALSVPVPSQGLHLVARFDPSVAPAIAAEAKQAAGTEGWLLADTYARARPLPGFVLGFSGHAVPQLVACAARLARESRAALRGKGRSTRRA